MARTLFMEERTRHVASIDLPSTGPLPTPAQLAAALAQPGDFALAFRGGRAYSLRLAPSAAPRARPAPASNNAAIIRSAFITGGTKGLGLEYAHSLVGQGCRLLVLVSRSGELPLRTLGAFAEAGVAVVAVRADSSDAAAMHKVSVFFFERKKTPTSQCRLRDYRLRVSIPSALCCVDLGRWVPTEDAN